MASNGSDPRPVQEESDRTLLASPNGVPAPPSDPQGIGSASRSCLVILTLLITLVLILCVSWVWRLLFL
ncbi:MAG: hypothetical protein M3Q71_12555 [Chloroflexota bacterium]|nr:hypothetical protein [Chloroflexota bacterium]